MKIEKRRIKTYCERTGANNINTIGPFTFTIEESAKFPDTRINSKLIWIYKGSEGEEK